MRYTVLFFALFIFYIPASFGIQLSDKIAFTTLKDFELSHSVGWSTPAIADINNDGALDIVVAGSSGTVDAYTLDGELLWSSTLPGGACSLTNSGDRLYSSPSIGSLHGDGSLQIVVGFGGFKGQACDGGVVSINGKDGSIDWVYSIKTWSKKSKQWAFRNAVVSTPALADTDGDGKLEVGFGSFSRHIYLLNHDGSARWVYQAADTVWSSATFMQADSDGQLEMVIGSDISANKKIKPVTKNGGFMLTFDTKPFSKLVPFRDPRKRILQGMSFFEQTVYSSPVVGDVFPGSEGDEIIVGSGCFFPQGKNPKEGMWMKVLSAKNKPLFTLPFDSCSSSSPALMDVNGDGVKDIIGAVSGGNGGTGIPMMRAYTVASGSVQELWEVEANSPQAFQSPVAVEGPESFILQPSPGKLKVVSAQDGVVLQNISVGFSFLNNPVVVDVDADAVPDIVVAGGGSLKIFKGASLQSFPTKRSGQWR